MSNFFVLEEGGRGHAIVRALLNGSGDNRITCIPGNPGIDCHPDVICRDMRISQHTAIATIAKAQQAITFVGPEGPLVGGIVKPFDAIGAPIIGPGDDATWLEGSKARCCDFLSGAGIPVPPYGVFTDVTAATNHIGASSGPWVIKADGLCGGKGVVIALESGMALATINNFMSGDRFDDAGKTIVIQECVTGREVSILAFVDGETVLPMTTSMDHKPVFENDRGPMTGGMGAVAPVPFVTAELYDLILQTIVRPTVAALVQKGIHYRGVIYFGLMITSTGPVVLEINIRFGDPEAQVVLPLLKTPLDEIFQAMAAGELSRIGDLEWHPGFACCVVMAAEGYPGKPVVGDEITGLGADGQLINRLGEHEIFVYHSGTSRQRCQWRTKSGRVLGVCCTARLLGMAIKGAYAGAGQIEWRGMHYRHDIGSKASR
ncbi:phosphoribosylamine--glycine ligase [Patescibacteria group bacterium]